MIYTIIRNIINTVNAAPRSIFTIALAWFFLSTSCGVMGLFSSPNFFNIIMLFFFSVMVAIALFGFAKFAMWRRSGLRETLPDGTVLLRLEHTLNVQTRERILLNARETTRTFTAQPVLVAPPSADDQLVPLKCSTCQQEVIVRTASLQKRRRRRLRLAFLSTLGIVITIALELGVNLITNGQPGTYPFGYAHFVSVVLLLIGTIGFVRLLNYTGVTLAKAPAGHRLTHPARSDLEQLGVQTSAQVQQ